MPELELLRRSPRARAWLGDVWAPAFGALRRRGAGGPPAAALHPAALAAAVGVDRVVRFPAGAPAAAGEVEGAYGPPDEADGSGLGPALAVLSAMAVPVDVPPLPQRWASPREGDGTGESTVQAGEKAPPRADAPPTSAAAPSAGVPVVDDDDDAVVTLHFIIEMHRDLLSPLTGHVFSIPPVVRGVFHRGTSEGLTFATVKAPPGVPANQLAIIEYVAPDGDGDGGRIHVVTVLGQGGACGVGGGGGGGVGGDDPTGGGALSLLMRTSAAMTPVGPVTTVGGQGVVPPPLVPCSAVAGSFAGWYAHFAGSYGMAYAPFPPPGLPLRGGGAPIDVVSLVLNSAPASPAMAFRLRSVAVSALVRTAPPRPLRGRGGGGRGGAADAPAGHGARRRRRRQVVLDEVADDAARARIVRNREAAGRSNAARREARLAARRQQQLPLAADDGGREEGEGAGGESLGRSRPQPPVGGGGMEVPATGGGAAAPSSLRPLLPRPLLPPA